MVNLFFTYTNRGPGKVVNNLIDGLNRIEIEHAGISKPKTRLEDR